MLRLLIAALAGGLFGAGLLISGMTDPAKVRGFLDVFGTWDPTLAFVMGGAILPMAIAWRVAARRKRAVTGHDLPNPPQGPVDGRLIAGSAMFGAGWGLAGLCPGPAMASLGFGGPAFVTFFVAMVTGMAVFKAWDGRR